MRHIDFFFQDLLKSLPEDVKENEGQTIDIILRAVDILQKKQSALAFLLKVSAPRESQSKIKIEKVIEGAMQQNALLIEKYNPTIELIDIPDVDIFSDEYQIVITHLISNAIIYHDNGTDERKITISVAQKNDHLLFSIKDNGLGVEEKYHDDVFNAFRRLHGENLYEDGVGMGLTIGKSIAQKYGGDISIKSIEGEGSEFILLIPNA